MIHEPTIIGIADSTHYLVGTTDNNGDFSSLPSLKRVAVCQSLADAKQILRDQHIETATLNLQSAYDEMCGLGVPSTTTETIFL